MRTINRFGIVVMALALVAAPLRAAEGPIAKSVEKAAVALAIADTVTKAEPAATDEITPRRSWKKIVIGTAMLVGGSAIAASTTDACFNSFSACSGREKKAAVVGGAIAVTGGFVAISELVGLFHHAPKGESAVVSGR